VRRAARLSHDRRFAGRPNKEPYTNTIENPDRLECTAAVLVVSRLGSGANLATANPDGRVARH